MADVQNPAKPLLIEPALALLEFSSVAAGVYAGDAMVKQAQLDVIYAGTVHPGKFLVLAGGSVAEVEEALKAGKENALNSLIDTIFLPGVHRDVVLALGGKRVPETNDAIGIVETNTVPAAIHAADKGIKGAEVSLVEIRLADGLNGKGLVFFTGQVSNIEAAIELSCAALQPGQLVKQVVISQLHEDMAKLIQAHTRFGSQVGWTSTE
ncbi:MAG: BMC domain-containing protein [Anaerolineaceae bacterium]|nr:BMC domain-containing protein [Anaerolineaceae bacterium]